MLAEYKIENIVTLNYGGKIIANHIFSQFFNENCRHKHYFVDNIGRKLEVLIEISSYWRGLCWYWKEVKFILYISSQQQGSVLRAQAEPRT